MDSLHLRAPSFCGPLVVPLNLHSGTLTWLAGKWTRIEDEFPIKNVDIPASYVIVYQRVFWKHFPPIPQKLPGEQTPLWHWCWDVPAIIPGVFLTLRTCGNINAAIEGRSLGLGYFWLMS